jgi:hypothetical protein
MGLFSRKQKVAEFADPLAGDGYFPNGRVAQNSLWYSPVTGSDMYGVPEDHLFQTGAYPERDDGPQYSMEQGMGRAPGQDWPHMPIREQFSFESTQNMSGLMEDTTADLPADSNANPLLGKAERAGWAMLGPALAGQYYAQEVHEHQWWPEPIPISVPDTAPLTALASVESQPYEVW